MAAPRTLEPLETYSNLVTNVPQWIIALQSLRDHTIEKKAEFVAEYARILQHATPRKIKSASLHSLHTGDDANTTLESGSPKAILSDADAPSSPANPIEISPLEAGNKYLYAQIRRGRKRKPDSSIRSGASGPQKFRSRQMVVIYYDAWVQEQLDSIVKKLGAARNELRKARQTNQLRQGLQLPRLGRKYDLGPSNSTDNLLRTAKVLAGKQGVTSMDSSLSPESPLRDAHADSTFVATDKDLEAAQNACETAAHQFIRDGDCKVELDTSLKRLQLVLGVARDVHRKLELEADEKRNNSRALKESDTDLDGNTDLNQREIPFSIPPYTISSLTNAKVTMIPSSLGPEKRLAMGMGLSPTPLSMGLGTAEIEVDDEGDDDESDFEIDIRQFRLARARRSRA